MDSHLGGFTTQIICIIDFLLNANDEMSKPMCVRYVLCVEIQVNIPTHITIRERKIKGKREGIREGNGYIFT